VYRAREDFSGWRAVLALAVPPLSFGPDFAVAWPTWNVMNTHASELTMSLVSLLAIGLCAAELWLVSAYVGERKPKALSGPEPIADADPATAGPIGISGRVRAGAGV